MTTDSYGRASLFVELAGERKNLWRNWQARNYPFVCALLEELGKSLPFNLTGAKPAALTSSGQDSNRPSRITRGGRSVRY